MHIPKTTAPGTICGVCTQTSSCSYRNLERSAWSRNSRLLDDFSEKIFSPKRVCTCCLCSWPLLSLSLILSLIITCYSYQRAAEHLYFGWWWSEVLRHGEVFAEEMELYFKRDGAFSTEFPPPIKWSSSFTGRWFTAELEWVAATIAADMSRTLRPSMEYWVCEHFTGHHIVL